MKTCFCNFFSSISIIVASLEIPEVNESTYQAEETAEDNPNLEVVIKIKNLNL